MFPSSQQTRLSLKSIFHCGLRSVIVPAEAKREDLLWDIAGNPLAYVENGGTVTTYNPITIDTSHVNLSPDLLDLVERLAQNNHDHWARKRIDEGWRYGVRRNDTEKEHPDLVPYKQLPDSEKEYDRKTVIEALKAIIALGYGLKKEKIKRARQ